MSFLLIISLVTILHQMNKEYQLNKASPFLVTFEIITKRLAKFLREITYFKLFD